jgi:hypothetical protein
MDALCHTPQRFDGVLMICDVFPAGRSSGRRPHANLILFLIILFLILFFFLGEILSIATH